MSAELDPSRFIGVAALLAVAGLIWLVFLRRAPEQTALGTIMTKEHQAPGTYVQQPVEVNRGFRLPREIPIAESYGFELRVEGMTEPVRASFNTVKSRQFEVGQRVQVRYMTRGLGPLWRRVTVVDMTPVESP